MRLEDWIMQVLAVAPVGEPAVARRAMTIILWQHRDVMKRLKFK